MENLENDVFERLLLHLSTLGMGYPPREALTEILRENLDADQAELLLHLPTRVAPLEAVAPEEVARTAGRPADEVASALEALAQRGLVYRGATDNGSVGYALHQVGFGFPQTFFWKGEETPHARNMAGLLGKYFSREVTRDAYSGSETKAYRYIPVERAIDKEIQAVYPIHAMESVIQNARTIAVAHCPCRVVMRLRGRACGHPEEVCLKFDEMAEYVIGRGLAREVNRQEARDIVQASEEAGLVHFVDNALSGVKHNCNCCGCACWNVGTIRRRKVPRDVLMATYFLRQTDADRCVGCGRCVEICPVDAIAMVDGVAEIDPDWCIGCGVCATRCEFDAIAVRLREDRGDVPADFRELQQKILEEKRGQWG